MTSTPSTRSSYASRGTAPNSGSGRRRCRMGACLEPGWPRATGAGRSTPQPLRQHVLGLFGALPAGLLGPPEEFGELAIPAALGILNIGV